MTSNLYSVANSSDYAGSPETNFNDLCTTNACRQFPYVACGNTCDATCQRIKWGNSAKFDYQNDLTACASGMSGDCGCKVPRSRWWDERATAMPMAMPLAYPMWGTPPMNTPAARAALLRGDQGPVPTSSIARFQ